MNDQPAPEDQRPPDGDALDFIVFEDELQVLDWQDSARGGMVVTFRVPNTEHDSHPFKRFHTGCRFYARMVEIGDDEQPVNQAQKARIQDALREREVKGGRVSKEAGILCNDPKFQEFVVDTLLTMSPADKRMMSAELPHDMVKALKESPLDLLKDPRMSGELAKWYMYTMCKIKSRRELDHKTDAYQRYQQHVMRPYIQWSRRSSP